MTSRRRSALENLGGSAPVALVQAKFILENKFKPILRSFSGLLQLSVNGFDRGPDHQPPEIEAADARQ